MGILSAGRRNNRLHSYKHICNFDGNIGYHECICHKTFKVKISKSSFSGTSLSILSSICVSCSSIGFLLISTFGGLGIVVSNFLSIYQTPLCIISIGILLFALYSIHKRITKSCVFGCNTTYNNKK